MGSRSLRNRVILVSKVLGLLVLSVCGRESRPARAADPIVRYAVEFETPIGIPPGLWRQRIPTENPLSAEKVALGESLFFDKRLSADGTISCATCHDPARAFVDSNVSALGPGGKPGTRNAPSILNAMFNELFFWDGRAQSLEDQAKQPMINPAEMGQQTHSAVVARVNADRGYRQRFRLVFKRAGVSIDTIAKAIAAYERTQLSGNSPFDRFLAGETKAISDVQKWGWELFQHKAQCINCHEFERASAPFFTDFNFHNTGVVTPQRSPDLFAANLRLIDFPDANNLPALGLLAHTEGFSELGRFLVTRQAKDIGAFKTPTLRDVELTMPYMHNGSQKTLLDVVKFYNRGGERNAFLDEQLRPLHLDDQEMSALVEFLRALTSDDILRKSQSTTPQTRGPAKRGSSMQQQD